MPPWDMVVMESWLNPPDTVVVVWGAGADWLRVTLLESSPIEREVTVPDPGATVSLEISTQEPAPELSSRDCCSIARFRIQIGRQRSF